MKIDSYTPEKELDLKGLELSPVTTNLVTQIIPNLFPMIGSILLRYNPSLMPVMIGLVVMTKLLEGFTNSIKVDESSLSQLGEKALLAGEQDIRPDRYNDFQDYLSDLKSIDVEEKNHFNFSSVDMMVTGLAIVAKGLGMTFNLSESVVTDTLKMVVADNQYFSSERLSNWLESGKMEEATDYFYDRVGSFVEYIEIKQELLELDIAMTDSVDGSLRAMDSAQDRLDNFRFD